MSAHSPAKSKNIVENIERNMSKGLKAKEKIKTMHDLLISLKDKELIATKQQKILDHKFSGIAKKLIEFKNAAKFELLLR